MSKIFLVSTLLLPLCLCLGSELSFAAKLKNGPKSDPAVIGMQGLLATAAPNLVSLPEDVIESHFQVFKMKDGTQVSGLYFKGENKAAKPLPLIIVNFGLFTDSHSHEISYFVKDLVLTQKLKADVLIVESVSSAEFFAQNHESGLGGYDEGRIFCELSSQFEILQSRPTYLVGISLGGNGVIQALIEDNRLKTHHFSGAVTFSAVLNETESSQALLTAFGEASPKLDPAHLGLSGRIVVKTVLKEMIKGLDRNDIDSTEAEDSPAAFYLRTFGIRLNRLAKLNADPSWNPAVSTASVAEYLRTSSALLENVKNLKVPLLVIHSKNDPLVPYSQFQEFETDYLDQKNILTQSTHFGGHWGFMSTYGGDWVLKMIQIMQSGDSWDLP